jgi:hypothetical protein
MTDQFTGRPINIDPFEIVKLLAGDTENFWADHHADEGTVTVEYVAVRDRTPYGVKRCAHLPAISSEIETPHRRTPADQSGFVSLGPKPANPH